MSLVVILLILLLIGGVGAGPWWGYSAGYGYGPSGIIGLLFVILLVLWLTGRI
jgi:hypothetical protein